MSHSDDQAGDDLHDPRSSRGSSLVGPFLGNELPVPTKDSVRRNERSNFGEGASPDCLAADSKTATLIIGQAELLATELLLEDSVLLAEVLDDRILLAADPASHGGNEDLPGLKDGGHPSIVARR